ncbi:stage V sporulation protein B [Salsuginibacillus halophilus]|uniref:Stage V sporulation protein B n=1 Tax=Salsuginibacillus halophilus TaxID=517424 RepID=A0A2P8HFY5_9BACI|nr:stage V sporulation protein B [Salsuginibacillus halophilus]PSL45116.1 stage V sporulation protein B [Salsuginibacillus halophilus]
MSAHTFIKGTIILILAGLITRFLGFINKIVVARIMGAEGMGLYMMAVPTLILLITLTQFGLPVAISKRVAEAETAGDEAEVQRILRVSLFVTGLLSIVWSTAVILGAPVIARELLTDERAYYALMAMIPIVPIVALSAILRGYFQGRQNMKPTAVSQVIEQVVRIALVAVCTKALLPYGIEFAAAGAMLSVVAGEFASLLYMLYTFQKQKGPRLRSKQVPVDAKNRKTFRGLLDVALPTTGSRLIGSLSYFFEPIVVAQSLAIAGVATATATAQYGELTGFVIPLLFLPTFITYALSVSLVPAVSEAYAKKDYQAVHQRLHQSLRTAMISGGIAAIVLFLYAKPIMTLMYDAPEAAVYLQLMAPFSLFLYFQGPLQAVLQAVDHAKTAMVNSLTGAAVKLAAIFILASRPEFEMMGTALAISISMVLVTLLHFAAVCKTIGFTFRLKPWLSAFGALLLTAALSGPAAAYTLSRTLLIDTLLGITLTGTLYIVLLLLTKQIQLKDISRVLSLQSLWRK